MEFDLLEFYSFPSLLLCQAECVPGRSYLLVDPLWFAEVSLQTSLTKSLWVDIFPCLQGDSLDRTFAFEVIFFLVFFQKDCHISGSQNLWIIKGRLRVFSNCVMAPILCGPDAFVWGMEVWILDGLVWGLLLPSQDMHSLLLHQHWLVSDWILSQNWHKHQPSLSFVKWILLGILQIHF